MMTDSFIYEFDEARDLYTVFRAPHGNINHLICMASANTKDELIGKLNRALHIVLSSADS